MYIQCKDCVSLAICISSFEFEKLGEYSYGYLWKWGGRQNSCNYLRNITNVDHIHESYHILKKFFLQQKGLINDKM